MPDSAPRTINYNTCALGRDGFYSMNLAVSGEITGEDTIVETAPPHGRVGLALAAGIAAAVVGAGLWALVTVLTNSELGLMAIVVGLLCGIAVRRAGGGSHAPVFGYIGAGAAALDWALGVVVSNVAMLAKGADVPFLDAFARLGVSDAVGLSMDNGDAMELLFLAIAVYEGWKFARPK